jgi:hypothetical protein
VKPTPTPRASGIESYIVRIYRRHPGRGRLLIGVVEQVGRDRRTAFGSADELWRILTVSRGRSGAGAGRRSAVPERARQGLRGR